MERKNKVPVICTLLVAAACLSCRHEGARPVIHQTILPYSVLDSARTVNGTDVTTVNSFIFAKDYLVVNDTVVAILNKPQATVLLNLVDIRTGDLLLQLVNKGNGPGEMLNCSMTRWKDELILQDFVKNTYARINIPEALSTKTAYRFQVQAYSRGIAFTGVAGYSKDSILLLNQRRFQSKELGLYYDFPRFLKLGAGECLSEEPPSGKFTTYNVSQGHIVSSKENDRIYFFSLEDSFVEKYDATGNLLSKLSGPVDLFPKYAFDDDDIYFTEGVPYGYLGVAADERHIYATYLGKKMYSARDLDSMDSYIFVFDWDGLVKQSYHLPFYAASISLAGGSIFVRSLKDGSPVLKKISIDDLP